MASRHSRDPGAPGGESAPSPANAPGTAPVESPALSSAPRRLLDPPRQPEIDPREAACDLTMGKTTLDELLARGFRLDAHFREMSFFQLVVGWKGAADHIEELVRRGLDPNEKDGHLLLRAITWPQNVAALLRVGVDPNATDGRGWTPLHAAARVGQKESVQVLLEGGADLLARSDEGDHAATTALLWGHEELYDELTAAGCPVEPIRIRGRPYGQNLEPGVRLALARGLLAPSEAWPLALQSKTVDLLAEIAAAPDVDVTETLDDGTTALHLAARHGKAKLWKILCDRGADPWAVTRDGVTPWLLARCGDEPGHRAIRDELRDASRLPAARPRDWAWDVGRGGPHHYLWVTTDESSTPPWREPYPPPDLREWEQREDVCVDEVALRVTRFWSGAGNQTPEQQLGALRDFFAKHPGEPISWQVFWGGDVGSRTVAWGRSARTLFEYLGHPADP